MSSTTQNNYFTNGANDTAECYKSGGVGIETQQEKKYTRGGYLVRDNGLDMFKDWMKGK